MEKNGKQELEEKNGVARREIARPGFYPFMVNTEGEGRLHLNQQWGAEYRCVGKQ